MLPGSESRDTIDVDERLGSSSPLELRRPNSGPRATIVVPHSLHSPQDRSTGLLTFYI